jgi:hypothetical protein
MAQSSYQAAETLVRKTSHSPQTMKTMNGTTLTDFIEMVPAQKSLFAVIDLALHTPKGLTTLVL